MRLFKLFFKKEKMEEVQIPKRKVKEIPKRAPELHYCVEYSHKKHGFSESIPAKDYCHAYDLKLQAESEGHWNVEIKTYLVS